MKRLSKSIIATLSLGIVLSTGSAMASQNIANLRCSGEMNGQPIGSANGRLLLAGLGNQSDADGYLVLTIRDASNESLLHRAIQLKNSRYRTRVSKDSGDRRLLSYDQIIKTNKIEIEKSGDIKIKNHDSVLSYRTRAITAIDDDVKADASITKSSYLTLRKDSLWIKEGKSSVVKDDFSFSLNTNISCKFGKPLTKKQFENLKKATGLIKKKKKKLEYKGPNHFVLLPS